MKQILFILIILFTPKIFACKCVDFNKKNIDKLKQKVDYIFIGKVVANINLENNQILDDLWKRNNSANEVVLEVKKIIKGKIKTKFIYLNQLNAGNCSRTFEKGKKYIVSGFEVIEFIDLTPKTKAIDDNKKNEELKIRETSLEKLKIPEIEFKESRFYINEIKINFKKWNELSKKETVILTNSCISGTIESSFGRVITESN